MMPMLLHLLADDNWQNQYTDTGWIQIVLVLVLCAFILFNIARSNRMAKKGEVMFIRRIPGMTAIDEAVGRATEMGRPVLMVNGLTGQVTPVVMQALNIFVYVTKTAAKFANPIIMCCNDVQTLTVAQEMIRDAYQSEGYVERFDPDSVRFISDRQFAYAAGVAGLILREKVAATFMMGDFFAESLIFAETANTIGAIQVASSTQTTQTPFFIAACDYVLIGDEYYAASAYLTRQPVLTGSIAGQDWSKILIGTIFVFGTLLNTYQRGIFHPNTTDVRKSDAKWSPLPKPDRLKATDTFMFNILNPQANPDLAKTIQRQKDPAQAEGQ